MKKKGEHITWSTYKANVPQNEPEEEVSDEQEMGDEEEADIDFVTAPTTNSGPRRPPGKRRSANIVRQQPCPSAAARQNLVNEVAFWDLFFTKEI